MKNVLLLHPGEMGTSIGANLAKKELEVFWVPNGRSSATSTRAEANGFKDTANLEAALRSAQVVLSICPPEFALELARQVADLGFNGIFVDGNAVSPETSLEISKLFSGQYVDGGIVGPPAWQSGTTRFYLSGKKAPEIAELFGDTWVEANVCSEAPGAASALKMAYAAYTKGSGALLLGIVALSEHYGVSQNLSDEWDLSMPGLSTRSAQSAKGTSGKAWRFVSEMNEIEKTFQAANLPGGFHQAAAEIYRRLADFKNDPQDLEAVVSKLLSTR